MDFLNLHKLTDKSQLRSGILLIAEPFLQDSIFSRSVIFLCEYSDEGALGFILNQPTDLLLDDLFADIYDSGLSVSQGGPVQVDTLHVLHHLPDVAGGKEVAEGVFWGGSFESLKEQNNLLGLDAKKIRFFVGYAGWSAGQLEKEMEEGTWLAAKPIQDIIFRDNIDDTWNDAINTLGKDYKYLLNMPINPQLN